MNRKQANKAKSPLIRLVGLEAAVAATGIAGSLAVATVQAAPGDLDPAFGDVGRQSDLGISTTLWSTDVAPDGSVFASGGEFEYDGWYGNYYEDNFSFRLLSTGAIASDFLAVPLENSVIYDAARQADDRLVEVGRVRLVNGSVRMQVTRRLPDGALDPSFGLNGTFQLNDGTTNGAVGRSVVVDADQRIVVAGTRVDSMIVVRLLPNGTLDPAFASGGLYAPANSIGATLYQPRIAVTAGDGYRIASNTLAVSANRACAVTALGEGGAVDTSYGESGIARAPSLPENTQPVLCGSMTVAPDGSVLLGGQQGTSAYLQRLLPDGSADPGFTNGGVTSNLNFVNAIAAPVSGMVYAGGYSSRSGLFGAPVLRLRSDGTLDTSYGQGGIAQVAIQANRPNDYSINDLQPGPGDTLVVGGTATSTRTDVQVPFVARLLGDSGPDGPGLLSLQQQNGFATESDQSAILKVSRIGGSTGAVAVSYRARDLTEYGPDSMAAGGVDYTQVTGRLTWDDGDTSEREITVPIAADTIAEQPEFFEVVLEAEEGGAGLAMSGAEVEIAGSSYPAGLITMSAPAEIPEGEIGYLNLYRSQYSLGAVSVTVRVAGGTAVPGADFSNPKVAADQWRDEVVTWADGEYGYKSVEFYVRRDTQDEATETVQFELVAATGGATLDPSVSPVVVSITDRTSPSSSGSGGGSLGWLAVALLGLLGRSRRLMRWPEGRHQRLQ